MAKGSTDITQAIVDILASRKSLMLATLDTNGEPRISYAPFVLVENNFYIFISELAAHTANLKQHAATQVMLIEDEAESPNIYARTRLSFECQSAFIARDEPSWTGILEQMEQRHGATVKMLKELRDFQLVQLQPQKGTFVRGFAQAYCFEGMQFEQAEQVGGR